MAKRTKNLQNCDLSARKKYELMGKFGKKILLWSNAISFCHSHAVAVPATVAVYGLGRRVGRAVGRRRRGRRGRDGVCGAHVGGRGALGVVPLLVVLVVVAGGGAVLVVVVVAAAVALLGLLGVVIVGEGLEILLQGLKLNIFSS